MMLTYLSKQFREDRSEGVEDAVLRPMTYDEATLWRGNQKQVSIWKVVMAQFVCLFALGAFAGWFFESEVVGWSAFYGGMSVALPSAVMAYGMTSGKVAKLFSVIPVYSLGSVFFWEGVKVLLVVVFLVMAPVVLGGLSWPALLAGLVLVLKVYWLALLMLTRV